MGVVITDFANSEHTLKLSWWAWRPLLQLILESNVVTDQDTLSIIGATDLLDINTDEARQIADYLQKSVLVNMQSGDRLLADSTITGEPDNGQLHRKPEDTDRNYSVEYETLVNFAEFCRNCQGFSVD